MAAINHSYFGNDNVELVRIGTHKPEEKWAAKTFSERVGPLGSHDRSCATPRVSAMNNKHRDAENFLSLILVTVPFPLSFIFYVFI